MDWRGRARDSFSSTFSSKSRSLRESFSSTGRTVIQRARSFSLKSFQIRKDLSMMNRDTPLHRTNRGRMSSRVAMSEAVLIGEMSEAIQPGIKTKTLEFVEGPWGLLAMTTCAVFALYGCDLWEACGPPPKRMDVVIYSFSTVVFLIFCLEIIVLSWCKKTYMPSFYFGLDVMAVVSLVPDVTMLFNVDVFLLLGGSGLTIARTARAARAAARSARIIRSMKLIAVVQRGMKSMRRCNNNTDGESKIGGKLASGVTQRIIIVIGVLLFSIGMLEILYHDNHTEQMMRVVATTLLSLYQQCRSPSPILQAGCPTNATCESFTSESGSSCHFNNYLRQAIVELNDDMGGACSRSTFDHDQDWRSCKLKQLDMLYDMKTYTFSGDCLAQQLRHLRVGSRCHAPEGHDCREYIPTECTGSCAESLQDSTLIVLADVEGARREAFINLLQVTFVIILLIISGLLFQKDTERLITRPLGKMTKIVENLSINPLAKIDDTDFDEEQGKYETDFVEVALRKFVRLLQVAFGEAGSQIIGQNLNVDGDLDYMVSGRKMSGIFGFAMVRNFVECTECLQEDVMVFVNTIADIVHRAVKENEGAPNKNIGSAFLLVWRMSDMNHSRTADTIADSALKSFIRASLEVRASEHLQKITDHQKIQERLPNYRVSMGFGLHVGWAIEGAIGSMKKIDASYLSPHVNLAARLESACEQFQVDILISAHFYRMLSPHVRDLCRRLDRVKVKGSEQPMEVYTYDVPPTQAKTLMELGITANIDFWVESYLEGNWDLAKTHVSECLEQWPEDGAGQVLMTVLAEHSFVAPSDWQGFRTLTNK